MQDKPQNLSPYKYVVIYISVVILGYIIFPVVWGLTNGLTVAAGIAADPNFQLELEKILSKDELDTLNIENVNQLLANLHKLPDPKKHAIETVTKKYLVAANWLPVHILANFVTFGILGFALGMFNAHRFSLLVPLSLLPLTLTVLTAESFLVVTRWLTISIGLLTEILAIYGVAVVGQWIRRKIG